MHGFANIKFLLIIHKIVIIVNETYDFDKHAYVYYIKTQYWRILCNQSFVDLVRIHGM